MSDLLETYRVLYQEPSVDEIGVFAGLPDKAREEWLERRKGTAECPVITATEAAVVLGHGYDDKTPLVLYKEKIHGVESTAAADKLLLGSYMESAILKVAERKRLIRVVEHFQYVSHSKKISFGENQEGLLSASLDACGVMYRIDKNGKKVVTPCVIEVKRAQNKFYWNLAMSNPKYFLEEGIDIYLPKNTYVQVQMQMFCSGVHDCAVLVDYAGTIYPIHVSYNEEFVNEAVGRCRSFMQALYERKPPDIKMWASVPLPLSEHRGVDIVRMELPEDSPHEDVLFYTDKEKERVKERGAYKKRIREQIVLLHDGKRNMLVALYRNGKHVANAKYAQGSQGYVMRLKQTNGE